MKVWLPPKKEITHSLLCFQVSIPSSVPCNVTAIILSEKEKKNEKKWKWKRVNLISFKQLSKKRMTWAIDHFHKWRPLLHSFVFMLIRPTALVLKQIFFWNLLVVARLVRLISIKAKEYFIWPSLWKRSNEWIFVRVSWYFWLLTAHNEKETYTGKTVSCSIINRELINRDSPIPILTTMPGSYLCSCRLL